MPPIRRPIVLVVDVEPDGRAKLDVAGGWKGSSDALEHLARLRGELENVTGAAVRFNWFLRADPQIEGVWGRADWVAEACPRIIRAIEDNDDYCGIHVHMWRWSRERSQWFSDLTDPVWTEQCLATAIDAFGKIFGRAPEASRFGDRWMTEHCVAALRRCGIRYDLTMEPGLPDMPIHDDPHATRWLPDFRGAPREPYVPLGNNHMAAGPVTGGDDLWMLPQTTTKTAWRLVRRPPYLVRGSRTPNLSLSSSYVWPHLRAQLNRPTRAPLVVVFRSGDLANRSFLRNFLRTTSELVRHPALAYCELTTPPEAVARWQASPT